MEPISATSISVVIPSYNRCACMLALLADVYRQEGVNFEVIVVDDCSSDDSAARISKEFPAVRLFVNKTNGGPAASRNRGIREARGELIVGFDSDVTFPDAWLLAKTAACFLKSPRIVALALRIFNPDGISDDVARWWHPLPCRYHADKEFVTSYFSGTAYAFRREAMIAAGLFPELLYMHYEEVELAWRTLDLDGQILYIPYLEVVHHANPVSRRSEVERFYKPRNQILLAASCLPVSHAMLFLLPRMFFQGSSACLGWHPVDFFRAIHSAFILLPQQLMVRKPLRQKTLNTIRSLKSHNARHHPAPTARKEVA